ncbi:MAG TPA: CHRD domain-containing protein [Planctomycetota bacterium]|nr:CHRD domain-containing protein [Planctomycetota bacterium]
MNARRSIALFLVFASAASAAGAQDAFGARLKASKAVPPTSSSAEGRGWFDLDPKTRKLRCRVETDAAATAVEVRFGAAGVTGTLLDTLSPADPSAWEGVTPALSASEVLELLEGAVHVVVYTANHPQGASGGAIRDQLSRSHARILAAVVNDGDTIPPATSPAFGFVQARLRLPERVLTYDVFVSSLSSPPTGAQLRLAPSGETGDALFPLVPENASPIPGLPHTWSGTSPLLTKAQCDALLDGEGYVSISTHAFPLGEVRGQLHAQAQAFVALFDAWPFPITGMAHLTVPPVESVATWEGQWSWVPTNPVFELYSGEPGVSETFLTNLFVVFAFAPPWLGGFAPMLSATLDDAWDGLLFVKSGVAGPWSADFHDHLRPNPTILGWPGPTSDGPLGRVLRIGAVGDGTIGESLAVTVHGAVAGSALSLCVETTSPPALDTPFDLGDFGGPGQRLWVSPDLAFPAIASAAGSASLSVPIPDVPELAGLAIPFQWIAIEPAANPLGIVVSDALRMVLVRSFSP